MPTAMPGTWKFAPDDGAMVSVPDYDHSYFGWWLNEVEDGAYGFQTFAGADGVSRRLRHRDGRHGRDRHLPWRGGRGVGAEDYLRGPGHGGQQRRVHGGGGS